MSDKTALRPSEPTLSLVIPFCDTWDITSQTLEKLALITTKPIELILIDNGSDSMYLDEATEICRGSNLLLDYLYNEENTGVLATFKQGLEESTTGVVCFIHNDVMIHELGWNERVENAFREDPLLGLAGLFGARGVNHDGGREGSMSHMLGQVWGHCDCHNPAALHHGELMTGEAYAAVFDGVGLFFRKSVLQDLADHTDIFADWRAPHHFYDRILSVKVAQMGYHMKVLGIQFDHYSGATANHSQKYVEFGKKWLKDHSHKVKDIGVDDTIYWLAEGQWRQEFNDKLPLRVDASGNYFWRAI